MRISAGSGAAFPCVASSCGAVERDARLGVAHGEADQDGRLSRVGRIEDHPGRVRLFRKRPRGGAEREGRGSPGVRERRGEPPVGLPIAVVHRRGKARELPGAAVGDRDGPARRIVSALGRSEGHLRAVGQDLRSRKHLHERAPAHALDTGGDHAGPFPVAGHPSFGVHRSHRPVGAGPRHPPPGQKAPLRTLDPGLESRRGSCDHGGLRRLYLDLLHVHHRHRGAFAGGESEQEQDASAQRCQAAPQISVAALIAGVVLVYGHGRTRSNRILSSFRRAFPGSLPGG